MSRPTERYAKVVVIALSILLLPACGYQVEEKIEGTPADASSDVVSAFCVGNLEPEPDAIALTPGQEATLSIRNNSTEPVTVIDIFMTGDMAFQFVDNPIVRANVDQIVVPTAESLNIRVTMLADTPPEEAPAAAGTVEVECVDEDGSTGLVIVEMLGQ